MAVCRGAAPRRVSRAPIVKRRCESPLDPPPRGHHAQARAVGLHAHVCRRSAKPLPAAPAGSQPRSAATSGSRAAKSAPLTGARPPPSRSSSCAPPPGRAARVRLDCCPSAGPGGRFGRAASGWAQPADQCRQSERMHQPGRFVTGQRAGIAPDSCAPAPSGDRPPRAA